MPLFHFRQMILHSRLPLFVSYQKCLSDLEQRAQRCGNLKPFAAVFFNIGVAVKDECNSDGLLLTQKSKQDLLPNV